ERLRRWRGRALLATLLTALLAAAEDALQQLPGLLLDPLARLALERRAQRLLPDLLQVGHREPWRIEAARQLHGDLRVAEILEDLRAVGMAGEQRADVDRVVQRAVEPGAAGDPELAAPGGELHQPGLDEAVAQLELRRQPLEIERASATRELQQARERRCGLEGGLAQRELAAAAVAAEPLQQ